MAGEQQKQKAGPVALTEQEMEQVTGGARFEVRDSFGRFIIRHPFEVGFVILPPFEAGGAAGTGSV